MGRRKEVSGLAKQATIKGLTAKERKERPVYSGVLKYFPDALLEVAYVSYVGNEQHNAGQPLHWDREKSTDELDALTRHLLHCGERDTDGMMHSAKLVWRGLANLQKEIEAERGSKPGEIVEANEDPKDFSFCAVHHTYKTHCLKHDVFYCGDCIMCLNERRAQSSERL